MSFNLSFSFPSLSLYTAMCYVLFITCLDPHPVFVVEQLHVRGRDGENVRSQGDKPGNLKHEQR